MTKREKLELEVLQLIKTTCWNDMMAADKITSHLSAIADAAQLAGNEECFNRITRIMALAQDLRAELGVMAE